MNKVTAQNYGSVSFDVFYNELSPYGYWDNDPNYGDIWFPNVDANFRPYSSNGYWTMTQYGNTWVSNYPWGWAPFHYGRWVQTRYNGWGWIPGYEWGPAWVDWRSGNGYYGWAPMAPRSRLSVNVSIGLPIDIWVFAPSRHIYDRNIYSHSHYGRPNIYNNTTIINNTYIVNNNHYHGGPSRRDIERSTGRRVTVRAIKDSQRPGSSRVDNRTVSMYRPDRNSNSNHGRNNGRLNTNPRNNNNSVRGQREMYIGQDGKSTIRERDNGSIRRTPTENSTIRRNEFENNSLRNRQSNSNSSDNRVSVGRSETSRTPNNTNPQRNTRPNQESQRRSSSPSIIHSASRSNMNTERKEVERRASFQVKRSNTTSNRNSNINSSRGSNEERVGSSRR